ncbi:MAG: ATP-binding protein, partial [Gammaproteobacteria bacterium]|nr:ATP-binding protein [Gammaproteobacteria bacterium]
MSGKTAKSGQEAAHRAKPPRIDPDADPARSGLLANISHELRTPMHAVLGYVDLLRETSLNDTQQTFLMQIERAAQGLLDIMDDILNLSRMEAGKLEINNQPFSIHDCVDSVSQMLAPSAYSRGLDFIRIIDHDVPVNFLGDPLRIRQILVNLLGNAIKFTKTGHVRLRVTAHPFDDRRYELVLRISDTGIGIADGDLDRLFEPFSRPAAPQGDISGTGLGLVISRSLSETMGGSIAVHSTPGVGSTFCVRIPLEMMGESFQTDDSANLLAQRNIVIACADAEQASWLSAALRQDGAITRIVPNIRQLAHAISMNKCRDDIAICVVGTQDLNDLQQLAQDWQPARGALPVLCLASSGSGDVLRQVADAVGGDAIPAHSAAESVSRKIAMLVQRHSVVNGGNREPVSAIPQALAGLHLLVADDNQFGRDYLQMLLSRHGATVDVCGDGRIACQMIADQHYDLVLMDVRMPHCDGIEAMQSLTDSGNQLPPIIGLTAAPEECCRALNSGMTD